MHERTLKNIEHAKKMAGATIEHIRASFPDGEALTAEALDDLKDCCEILEKAEKAKAMIEDRRNPHTSPMPAASRATT